MLIRRLRLVKAYASGELIKICKKSFELISPLEVLATRQVLHNILVAITIR